MKLTLKNIGKVEKASVEINGITVIAGENSTGKSTVGRALFAVFNSFHNVQKQIQNARVDSIENYLDRMCMTVGLRSIEVFPTNEIAKEIVSHIDAYRDLDLHDLQQKLVSLFSQYDEDRSKVIDRFIRDEIISRIKEILEVSDNSFLKSLLERKLGAEFNEQVCNIFSENDGEICLQIKDKPITVSIENTGTVDFRNSESLSLHTEVVYIDDPFILDNLREPRWRDSFSSMNHRYHLRAKLMQPKAETNVIDEIIVQDKLNGVYEKLSSVCSGDIIIKERGFTISYRRKGSEKELDVRNLSTGLKTFVILKMLLLNGTIEPNGAIILDEPELHLHPEWQLLFAELIVLIQKEFGVHILLNTHSPYFLRAIQVYSATHGIADICKYYLSEVVNEYATLTDVTENIEQIYAKLARPLQKLEDERWKDG